MEDIIQWELHGRKKPRKNRRLAFSFYKLYHYDSFYLLHLSCSFALHYTPDSVFSLALPSIILQLLSDIVFPPQLAVSVPFYFSSIHILPFHTLGRCSAVAQLASMKHP